MKKARLLGASIAGILLLFALWTFTVKCPLLSYNIFPYNIGLPYGYFGNFNRVKHRLKQVSGIRILGYHQHRDLSIEDFWFTVQTEKGLTFDLQFAGGHRADEIFDQADGLAVKDPDSGSYLLYPFGSGERLEVAVGKEMRSAVDVLKSFEKIAEVVEADRQKAVSEARLEDVPGRYLRIIFPSFYYGHELLIPM
jgi:hypothetical protein